MEKKLFDDAVHVSEEFMKQAEAEIGAVVETQGETLNEVIKNYNILAFDAPVTFKDDAKYRLTAEVQPDEAWVQESIDHLIEIAERESGYKYSTEN